MSNNVNIILAADDNYAQHTAVVMASILLSANKTDDICFFVLDDGISEEKKAKIRETAAVLGGELAFVSAEENLAGVFVDGFLSRAAYLRLYLTKLLPDVTRGIYLDSDLLVMEDIHGLWATDMENMPLAAVDDYGIMASAKSRRQKKKVLGFNLGEPYFNSGVLLMDLGKWREIGYDKELWELAAKSSFPHHDQDILNKVFRGKRKKIPLKWNVIPPVYNMFLKIVAKPSFRNAATKARENPAVIHYAGTYKPWEYERVEKFNGYYYDCLEKTAFRDAPMPQIDKRKKNHSIKRQLFRMRLGDMWGRIFS